MGDLREAYARVFAAVDVKGRGCLSRDQLIFALRILNFNPIDSEIEEMMEENNKEYNFEQFVAFIKELKVPPIEKQKLDLRNAFSLFDKSDTGCILKDEFLKILTRCGEMKIDEKEAMSWVETLDHHNDGKLRIAELEELFVNDEDVSSILNGQSWDMV